MANFVDRSGIRQISGQTVQAEWSDASRTTVVGLWGYLERPGTALSVVARDSTHVLVSPKQVVGVVQFYDVQAEQLGNVRLEAQSSTGGVWDYINVSFVAAQDNLAEAAKRKRIVFNNASDLSLVQSIEREESPAVSVAPELVRLLLGLSKHGVVQVLSLYRRGQGPHGVVQPDGSVVCRGVDIMAYAGNAVTLVDPNKAIAVVEDLISYFPSGKYDLGFPRPVGGETGFDPAQDVFFPVPDLAAAKLAFAGRAGTPFSNMLQPAQGRIKAAMAQRGARFPFCIQTD